MGFLNAFLQRLSSILRSLSRTAAPPSSLPKLTPDQRAALEVLLGKSIGDETLFVTALTHRSAIDFIDKDIFVSNERLEFLGDAVLDLIVAERLYSQYPDFDEGSLTKLRSQIVNAQTLAIHARKFELNKLLIVSDSAEQNGVRESDTALADAFEAIIGAVYLDSHYQQARLFLDHHLLSVTDFSSLIDFDRNYKSILLEFAQAERLPLPCYFVLSEDGPSHKKIFTIGVKVGDELLGQGSGKSKKSAEQIAAKEAIDKLKPRYQKNATSPLAQPQPTAAQPTLQ
jgi:ribonuclease III